MITKLWETIGAVIPTFMLNRRSFHIVHASNEPVGQENDRISANIGRTHSPRRMMIPEQPPKKQQTRVILRPKLELNIQQNEKPTKYSLKPIEGSKSSPIEVQEQLHEDIIYECRQLTENLQELEKASSIISQYHESSLPQRLASRLQLYQRAEQVLSDEADVSPEVKKLYEQQIVERRKLKYQSQLKEFPKITIAEFKNVIKMWEDKSKNHEKIKRPERTSISLDYRSIGSLKWRSWLNDNVICSYIEIMNQELAKRNSRYKILDSLFSASVFGQDKQPDVLRRSLKRKKVQADNIMIVAVNTGNHWFFVKVHDSRIHIYDSMRRSKPSDYERQPVVGNLIKLTDWYYGKKYQIEVNQTFPQQKNHYDCGIFMTFGIKDVARDKEGCWSFSQVDCQFKRVQMVLQLLAEDITGFDQIQQQS